MSPARLPPHATLGPRTRQRKPRSCLFIDQEEKARLLPHLHLRMVAPIHQFRVPLNQRRVQVNCVADCLPQYLRTESMETGSCGIDDDESPARKYPRY